MGLSEKALQKKREYNRKYKDESIKRITLDFTEDDYNKIEKAAANVNEKVRTYIRNATFERINRSE